MLTTDEQKKYNNSKKIDKVKFDKDQTEIIYSKKSFVYDFLASMRQKINDPLGVRKKRREEGIPLLEEKFWNNLNTCFDNDKSKLIYDLCLDQEKLEKTKVHEFMELFAK